MKKAKPLPNPLSEALKSGHGRISAQSMSLVFGTIGLSLQSIDPPVISRHYAGVEYTDTIGSGESLRSLSVRWHGSSEIGATAVSIYSLDGVIRPTHQIAFSPYRKAAEPNRTAAFHLAGEGGELRLAAELDEINMAEHELLLNPYIRAINLALVNVQAGSAK